VWLVLFCYWPDDISRIAMAQKQRPFLVHSAQQLTVVL
jgi:hypothetical protein